MAALTETQRHYIRRCRAIGAELDALAAYEKGLTAERSGLLKALNKSLSQREIARQLGISQPRIRQILLHRKK